MTMLLLAVLSLDELLDQDPAATGRLVEVDGRLDYLVWHTLDVDHDPAGAADCLTELRCPHVFPDHDERGRVRLEGGPDLLHVVVVDQAVTLIGDGLERLEDLVTCVLKLDACDLAVLVLEDEGEVDDPDRAGLHQLFEGGCDLTLELVTGERNDPVLDWSDAHRACSFVSWVPGRGAVDTPPPGHPLSLGNQHHDASPARDDATGRCRDRHVDETSCLTGAVGAQVRGAYPQGPSR